jgi:glycosyltransferase involved in cell wall biosynthesis
MITVIIPFKGVFSNLENCLGSFVNLNEVSEVLIGVDGRMLDQVGDVIEITPNPKIKFIEFVEEPGISYILNQLLDTATNDLVARMDADDRVIRNRFKDQLDFMNINKTTAILAGNILLQSTQSIPKRKTGNLVCRNFLFENPIAHPTVMFRKSEIQRALDTSGNYYNVRFRKSQDYELWIRIVRVAQIFNSNKVWIEYDDRFSKKTFLKQHAYFSYAMLKNFFYHFIQQKCPCATKFQWRDIESILTRLLVYPLKVILIGKSSNV